jgi:N-acyl-L-homoserine lactone synthetase
MSAAALAPARSFSGRLSNLLERVDYRLVESDEDRETIFRLRYNAYLREGAIAPLLTKKLHDHYDDAENSWIFGLFIDDRLVSSLRICASSPAHPMTPAVEAFPDVLGPEVERGAIIVDPNRFVADYEATRRFPELPYLTTRLSFVSSAYFDADIATASVRREHQAFYKRVFLYAPVCEPRPYPTLVKPLSLMTVVCREVRAKILHRYPCYHSTIFERRMLFERRVLPLKSVAMLKAKLPTANTNRAERTLASLNRR